MAWSQSIDFEASHIERCWLSSSGSLTRRLQSLGSFELKVLSERSSFPHADETIGPERLNFSIFWIREVVMSIKDEPCVCARSLIPTDDGGVWENARGLGATPLGTILYGRSVERRGYAYSIVESGSALHETCSGFGDRGRRIARRSRFVKSGVPILVSECFLPQFWRIDTLERMTMECLG
jgi:chorismate--pyruvate lyase